MRIAHLISQFYPYLGGAEICIHNICTALKENGEQATVITSSPAPAAAPAVNYEIIHLSPRTNGLFRRSHILGGIYLGYALKKLQNRYRFDLWQVTMGYPLGTFAVNFFRKQSLPCLLRCCGEDIQRFPEINYGYRLDQKVDRLVREKYPRYDALIALTPSVQKDYLEIGVAADKIAVIPNGVDVQRFTQTAKDAALRKQFGADAQTPLILTVGRHHPKKGYQFIPEIAAGLKERGLRFVWLIVGRDFEEFNKKFPEAAQLGIRTIADLPSPGIEAFSLPSNHLVKLYRAADVFAFPTLLETFGMVLIEAMAAGLPIVTTDAPGVCDVIHHEQNGLCSPRGDTGAFVRNLAAVLENPTLSARLSQASTADARRYDWRQIVSQYLALYRRTLAKAGKK